MELNWFISNLRKCVIFFILSFLFTLLACSDIQEQTTSPQPDAISTETTETAREKALNYVSSKYGIPKESLIVYSQESGILDPYLNEEGEIFAIGDKQVAIAKVVVDSAGKVMEACEYNEYRLATGKSGKAVAGNINPGLYNYLQDKKPDEIVKVKIIISNNSEVVTFIESKGFKITNIGDLPNGRMVYVELPKYFILELAKRSDVADIEQDSPIAPP